jgi:Carboxypeptidase regulatory-like domain
MRRLIAATALLVAAIDSAHAQQTTAAIQGRIVADDTGDPVAHARVVVYQDKTAEALSFTDSEGRYSVAAPSGRGGRVVVSKTSYAPADIGLSELALSEPLNVRLRLGGAISGRVTDARGEPYSNAVVNLVQPRPGSDIPTLKTAVTDDLGEYRLFGIPQGNDYVVELAVMQRDMLAMFYPGTDKIDAAERITVRAGAEKTGVDFVTDTVRPLPSVEGRAALLLLQNGGPILVTSGRIGLDAEQRPTRGNGVIRGRVTLPSGAALPTATVTLVSMRDVRSTRPPRSASTDNDGRFVFDGLPPAEYVLGAAKSGYVSSDAVGGDAEFGTQIRLADGEVRDNAGFVLTPPAAITGRVLDEFGEPFEGAAVIVWRIGYEAGRRQLLNVAISNNMTDDRGRYRVFNIPPGRYLVSAAAGRATPATAIGDLQGYSLTFFPSTTTPAEAQLVTLAGTVADFDIGLLRRPTAQIRGRILSTSRQFLAMMTLSVSHRSKGIAGPDFTAIREDNGEFEFRGVPPGDYVLQVEGGRMNSSTEGDFAAQFVTVTGPDVTDVVLQSTPGSTIAGHVTFDGPDAPLDAELAVVPASADLDLAPRKARSIARADVKLDNTFEIRGVHGPRRIEIEPLPRGWAMKSVLANGIDVTDRALPFGEPQQSLSDVEVVLTNRLTELAGSVTDARGDATRNYTLLVFPIDRERWYPGSRFFRRVAPEASGSFAVRGLPPGDYHIAAVSVGGVPRDGETAWQDPEFLESIASRAAFAALTEGQKLSISARLITP